MTLTSPLGSVPGSPPADPTLADLYHRAPELYALLDPDRLASEEPPPPTDFEDAPTGGRGDSYRLAQDDPTVRMRDIRQLFTMASPATRWTPGARDTCSSIYWAAMEHWHARSNGSHRRPAVRRF
jgi:hypothetical protein